MKFISLYTINIILTYYLSISQECSGKANDPNDCFKLTKEEKYPDFCCYYESINGNNKDKFCKSIPYSSYIGGYQYEYINGILYSYNCNTQLKTYALERCGNTYDKVSGLGDCKKYSTFVDSCCYYSGENDEDDPEIEGEKMDKGCYWLGSKYDGSIFWAGARLKCLGTYLKVSIFYFILAIFNLF